MVAVLGEHEADDSRVQQHDASDELGERLLAAAAEVFAERGYDKAGVAEIARRAGVTTGAIYSRYRGKAELLVEAIDPHATDELEALFNDSEFDGRMEEILRMAGTHLVKGRAQSGGRIGTSLLLEVFTAARRHDEVAEVMRARLRERNDRLTEIVDVAKAAGGIDPDIDTESLVTFSQALAFGFLILDVTGLPIPAPGPWEELVNRVVDALGEQRP